MPARLSAFLQALVLACPTALPLNVNTRSRCFPNSSRSTAIASSFNGAPISKNCAHFVWWGSGVLAKPQAIKTVLQSDTAKIHAYENCELADWVEVKY
jgi:hypothetical protein